jgi:hypothetical protein
MGVLELKMLRAATKSSAARNFSELHHMQTKNL